MGLTGPANHPISDGAKTLVEPLKVLLSVATCALRAITGTG